MFSTYKKKQTTSQKMVNSQATPVLDSSPHNKGLQRKADLMNSAVQHAETPRPNNTGMPDNLKSGIESLSGFSMDDVRVHYNSSKPATVQALAYTQGTDIHVAPGQEKHLPHEAWHVAQQMAGRVSPTTNINGMPVNDNAALEHEADVMGEKATQCMVNNSIQKQSYQTKDNALQRMCRIGKKTLIFASSKSTSSHDEGSVRNGLDLLPFSSSGLSSSFVWPTVGSNAASASSSSGFKDPVSNRKLHSPQQKATQDSKHKVKNPEIEHPPGKIFHKDKWHIWNIGFYHAHFWFNHNYKLPYTDGEKEGNNIGYGGHLYDDTQNQDKYDLSEPISHQKSKKNLKDEHIIEAIKDNKDFGAYNPISNNCQHWVNKVINDARKKKETEEK